MNDRQSTARSREIGMTLRRLREQAGIQHGAALAAKLDWSQGRMSRLEQGRRGGTPADVALIAGYLRIDPEICTRLLALATERHTRTWARPLRGTAPDALTTVRLHESMAESITCYDPLVIPAPLQTAEYTRGLLTQPRPDDGDCLDWIAEHVAARRDRQTELFRAVSAKLVVYIPQRVLRTPVGGNDVLSAQLQHMSVLAREQCCRIRIVPPDVPTGMFELMTFALHEPMVYIETATTALFLDDPADIDNFQSAIRRLDAAALSEEESMVWLADHAEGTIDHSGATKRAVGMIGGDPDPTRRCCATPAAAEPRQVGGGAGLTMRLA